MAQDLEDKRRRPTGRIVAAIPNALSLFRLALGLGFPWWPASWRMGVALVAMLTDLVDGAISRRLHAATSAGRILDPIADKVFVLAVVATLLWDDTLQFWEALLVGLRDLTVLAGAGWVALRRNWPAYRRMAPTLLGKATTATQFLFLLSLLFHQQPMPAHFWPTAALSFLAAVGYLRVYLIQVRHGRREPPT